MSFTKGLSTTKCRLVSSFAAAFFAVFFLVTVQVHAATLAVSPSGGSSSVGKTISVRVVVGSGGQSVNAVSGTLHFSNDLLTLNSISKSGVVTLWAQEPSYSNASGSITFQGVILNGYTGSSGTVLTLNFRAKAEGTATISISGSGSSVLLNDGQGTDVLSGTSGASFSIEKGAVTPPSSTKPVVTQPSVIATPPATEPAAPAATVTPAFTDYQSPLQRGNFVVVKGTASPNTIVNISFTETDAAGHTVVSQDPIPVNAAGAFTFVSDEKVTEGSVYKLTASTTDGKSSSSLTLSVKNSLWFVLKLWFLSIIAVQMSVALAILILMIITGYLLYRNHLLRKHLQMALDQIHDMQQK